MDSPNLRATYGLLMTNTKNIPINKIKKANERSVSGGISEWKQIHSKQKETRGANINCFSHNIQSFDSTPKSFGKF